MMIHISPRLPRFCMGRGTARVRTRSPQQQVQFRRSYSSIKTTLSSEFSSKNSTEMNYNAGSSGEATSSDGELSVCGNRVMIVVDSSVEAKAALSWALSHTVQPRDTIILLHVMLTKPSAQGRNSNPELNRRAYELLSSTKNMCQMQKPGVQVEMAVKEAKEKGAAIVQEARQEKVSLLVLGKRKKSIMWRLQKIWTGKRKRTIGSVADYCVQNADCMTIAVRRKSRKYGGYLITTKRHRDFWLLA